MEVITRTCSDCGRLIEMNATSSPEPQDSKAIARIMETFDQFCKDNGWKYVKFGFFCLDRKWVCNKCQVRYG